MVIAVNVTLNDMDDFRTKPARAEVLSELGRKPSCRCFHLLVVDEAGTIGQLVEEKATAADDIRATSVSDIRRAISVLGDVDGVVLLLDADSTRHAEEARRLRAVGYAGAILSVAPGWDASEQASWLEAGGSGLVELPVSVETLREFLRCGKYSSDLREPQYQSLTQEDHALASSPVGPQVSQVVRVDPDVADLVAVYLENLATVPAELASLAAQGVLDELRRMGHNLKGSGASYGFSEISRLGSRIELSAKDGDLEAVLATSAELAAYLTALRWEVEN